MNWSISVNKVLRTITVSLWGKWKLSDAEKSLESMWSEQGGTGIHRVLWDAREDVADGATTSELRELAHRQLHDRPKLPEARAALVTTGDFEFGMARMIEAFIADSPIDLRIFRDLSHAFDWLTAEK